MFKILLPLMILLIGCGKKIEEEPKTEEVRSPDSAPIEAEITLKAGVSSFGSPYYTEHKNEVDDLCLDIPKKITDLSGTFDENSDLKLEINKTDGNSTDYVYCYYKLTDKDYSISDCFDYQDRSLGVRSFWFSYIDKSLNFSFKNITTNNRRQARLMIQLKACGSVGP